MDTVRSDGNRERRVSLWQKSIHRVLNKKETSSVDTTTHKDGIDHSRNRLFNVLSQETGEQVEWVKFLDDGVSIRQKDGTLFQVFIKSGCIGEPIMKFAHIPNVMHDYGFVESQVLNMINTYIDALIADYQRRTWDSLNGTSRVKKIDAPNLLGFQVSTEYKKVDILFPSGKIIAVFCHDEELFIQFDNHSKVWVFNLGNTIPFCFYAWSAIPTVLANIISIDPEDKDAVKGLKEIELYYNRLLMRRLGIKSLYKKKHCKVLHEVSTAFALYYLREYQILNCKEVLSDKLHTTSEKITRRRSFLR